MLRIVVRIELKFSENIVFDRVFRLSTWYWVWPPLAVITALSRRGMLRARTSIISGVTVPRVCNRASCNPATVVGGLSISLMTAPSGPRYVFRSGLWAGHCMTSTSSSIKKLRVFRAVWGVPLSCKSTHFFKVALAQERRFWRKMPM